MLNHPSVRGRRIVLIGELAATLSFATAHDLDRGRVWRYVERASQLAALLPFDKVHLVVHSDSVLDWRDPNAMLLRTGIALLQSNGATVEWV